MKLLLLLCVLRQQSRKVDFTIPQLIFFTAQVRDLVCFPFQSAYDGKLVALMSNSLTAVYVSV